MKKLRQTDVPARRWWLTALTTALLGACASPAPTALSVLNAIPPVLTPQRIAAIVASPTRTDADRANDLRRKPEQLLAFIGIRPGMVALDLSAGDGYTTELLLRAVGSDGEVYGQSAPRTTRPGPAQPEGGAITPTPATTPAPSAGPPRTSAVMVSERATRLKAGNLTAIVQPFEDPIPPGRVDARLDLVTMMFNYHDLGHMGVNRARMNAAVYAALKPGGMYVVADHAGRPGTGITESGTLHRIDEAFLREEIERAGFKLAAEGQFLRNPNDPRDRNTPEPPQPKDEFIFKFVKP